MPEEAPLFSWANAATKISAAVSAILLAGAILYVSYEDRRFEAQRADRDRELLTQLLKKSLIRQEEQFTQQHAQNMKRIDVFLSQQAEQVENQERSNVILGEISGILDRQESLMQGLREENRRNSQALKESFKQDTDRVIKLLTPPTEK